jgi:hypothetical protein
LPSLRVLRDRGGIEHVFVVHPIRENGRVRHRVLYWFRTVSHARGGRTMLDEATRRDIEAAFPELVFNWPEMLRTVETMSWAEPGAHRSRERRSPSADAAPAESSGPRSEVAGALVTVASEAPASRVADGAPESTSGAERQRRRRRSRRGRRGAGRGGASNGTASNGTAATDPAGRVGADEDERPASL